VVLVVVQRWTASSTSYIFVLMPVVDVALGALVVDERITGTTILGGAIGCAGVDLGVLARRVGVTVAHALR
jgi:drug/metabolite transporter (DMT)-like permease